MFNLFKGHSLSISHLYRGSTTDSQGSMITRGQIGTSTMKKHPSFGIIRSRSINLQDQRLKGRDPFFHSSNIRTSNVHSSNLLGSNISFGRFPLNDSI